MRLVKNTKSEDKSVTADIVCCFWRTPVKHAGTQCELLKPKQENRKNMQENKRNGPTDFVSAKSGQIISVNPVSLDRANVLLDAVKDESSGAMSRHISFLGEYAVNIGQKSVKTHFELTFNRY